MVITVIIIIITVVIVVVVVRHVLERGCRVWTA